MADNTEGTCHAIERARERYGIHLRWRDLLNMQEDIVSGKAVLVRHEQNDHIASYLCSVRTPSQTRVLRVVYDARRREIVTVLPATENKARHKHKRMRRCDRNRADKARRRERKAAIYEQRKRGW